MSAMEVINILKVLLSSYFFVFAFYTIKNKKTYYDYAWPIGLCFIIGFIIRSLSLPESSVHIFIDKLLPTIYSQLSFIDLLLFISISLALIFSVMYDKDQLKDWKESLMVLLFFFSINAIIIGIKSIDIINGLSIYRQIFYIYINFIFNAYIIISFFLINKKNGEKISMIMTIISVIYFVSFASLKTIYPDFYPGIKAVMSSIIPNTVIITSYSISLILKIKEGDDNMIKNIKLYFMAIYGAMIFLPIGFLAIEKLTGKGMDIITGIVITGLGIVLVGSIQKAVSWVKKEI